MSTDLIKAIAHAKGCMTCEGTGEAVVRYANDMSPMEFGACPECAAFADSLAPTLAALEAQARKDELLGAANEIEALNPVNTAPGYLRHLAGRITAAASTSSHGSQKDAERRGGREALFAAADRMSKLDAPGPGYANWVRAFAADLYECRAPHPNSNNLFCTLDKDHTEEQHMSTTGCAGSVVYWPVPPSDSTEETPPASTEAGAGDER